MKSICYIVVIFLYMGMSCTTHKSKANNYVVSQNEIFSIAGDCVFKIDQGIDSQVGTVSCGDVEMKYDYGRFSYPGPITLEEDFVNGFRGNFFVKFFDLIHIDPKVHRLFLDSVMVLSIRKPLAQDKLLFQCPNCNALATISFRNRTYLYPYTNNKTLWTNTDYKITTDTILGYRRKLYISAVDTLPSGVHMTPVINPRQANKLSVTALLKRDPETTRKLLLSIRIVKTQ